MPYERIQERVGLNEEKIDMLMNAYAETGEAELLDLADTARKENELLHAQLKAMLYMSYPLAPANLQDKVAL